MTNRPAITLRQRPELDGDKPPRKTLDQLVSEAIHEALRENGGNMMRTARELGVDTRTLYRKLARMEADYAAQPVAIQEVE